MKIRMDEMSWPEIKDVLGKSNVVVVPIGSTEQHGMHLPVNVDSFCATYVANHAAEKVGAENNIPVLVAPTIHYTDVAVHKMFPGTIGVKTQTLINVIYDVVISFLEQGFNNVIAFTSHHENSGPIEIALSMITEEHPKAKIFGVNSMGLGFDVRPGLIKAGTAGMGHALEIETSMSLLMQPENVHLERAKIGSRKLSLSTRYIGATGSDRSKGIVFRPGSTGFETTGTFGDPTMSTKEEGEKITTAMVNDLADIIVQVAKLER